MVSVSYYSEESQEQSSQQASSSTSPLEAQTYILEGQYQMDHNTIWVITNGMARPEGPNGPRPYKSGPSPALPTGTCFNCGGDHWARDCPHPRKEKPYVTGPQPLTRFCELLRR